MKTLHVILLLVFLFSMRLTAQQEKLYQLESPQHLPPEPQFSWTGACFGDSTKFVNASLRAVIFEWYIMDEQMDTIFRSNATDITYYFPYPDTFYVYLEANNGHIVGIQDTVVIGSGLNADFGYMHCTNQFLNYSYCASTFSWDFGDGNTSTDALPVHQYADTGVYVVTLTAGNGVSSDVITQQVHITVVAYPDPNFTVNLSNDTLYYQLTNPIPYANINWSFGDGGVSHVAQGYHIYTADSTYYVGVNVINECSFSIHDTMIDYIAEVGIKKIGRPESMVVYPNPSTDGIFNITTTDQLQKLVVYNTQGVVLMELEERPANGSVLLDLSRFANGCYILRAIGNNGTYARKLIREGLLIIQDP